MPQRLPQPQKQDAVLPAGMSEHRPHMLGQQVGPFFQARARPAVGRLLDHQAADRPRAAASAPDGDPPNRRRSIRGSGSISGMSFTSREPLSWMKLAERLFDLRRKVLDPAAEGDRLAQLDDPRGDGGHGPRQIGAGIDLVLAADGDDRRLASLVHGDAQPVAAQELPPVVGGGRGDLRDVLPALQLQDELLEVGQKGRRIAGCGRFGLASFEIPRRVPGHLFDELQKPGARLARRVGPLEDLDGPDAVLADLQGRHDDQKIDRHLARHRRIVGRERGGLPGRDRVAQQSLVRAAAAFALSRMPMSA